MIETVKLSYFVEKGQELIVNSTIIIRYNMTRIRIKRL